MAAHSSREEGVAQEAVIQNRLGLHARPAAMFVREANRHRCDIHVEKDGETIRIRANGAGAPEALQSLLQLVERKFDEE